MTTTQPPLKPGDRVLVEAKAADVPGWLTILGTDEPDPADIEMERCVWRRLPAEDGPDATHVARLEAELAALRKVYDAAEAWRDRLAQHLAMAPKRVVLTDRAPALVAAVDAFRAAQAAPATAPDATLADETPATLPEPGDAPSEAQRGAEAVCALRDGPGDAAPATSTPDGTTTASEECGYADRDLSSNRPLVCKLPPGHAPGHRFRWADGGAA